jgi:hypothetical protein
MIFTRHLRLHRLIRSRMGAFLEIPSVQLP